MKRIKLYLLLTVFSYGSLQATEPIVESTMEESITPKTVSNFEKFPDYEKVAEKIAREIMRVDENNESLTEKYQSIIKDAFLSSASKTSVNKHVLIIGAGISGLLTGKILQRNGYHVTILEADPSRVGGRIKTIRHEEGKESPFVDPFLYAEAGAMRIPTSHPLVMTLIDKLGLQSQSQPFYNVDVRRDNPAESSLSTWVSANGEHQRTRDYVTPSSGKPSLGFRLPEKYLNKSAKALLDEALLPLISRIKSEDINDPKERLEKQIKEWTDIVKEFDGISMRQYLQKIYPEEVVIDYIGTLQNLTSRLHLSFIHSFVDTFYINPTTQYREIKGGNYNLTRALAESLDSNTIVMNARVNEIQWSDAQNPLTIENKNTESCYKGKTGVYVHTVGERTDPTSITRQFKADYLVTSIPFSGFGSLERHPRFSYEKERAIRGLHYDSATKVFLEFNERFWEWDKAEWAEKLCDDYKGHNSIGGGTITDSWNRFMYFPSNSSPESKGGVVLASYTWSDDANRWDSTPIKDRAEIALRGLTDIYGKGILRFYTGRCQTESWMQNPYAYGEAAVFTPGQILTLYPNVGTSEGPVHFIGEHASMKHAWIEGAIESAVRTALEIINKDKIAQK